MSDPALAGYFDKWLKARPAQSLGLSFLPAAQRQSRMALAAFEHELVTASYNVAEPQVAAVKIQWWGEELGGAPAGGGRHPLTRALFADAAIRAIDPALWMAPVMASLRQLEAATAVDFDTQLAEAEALHGALARLETAIWFGSDADPARAARMAALDHLLQAAIHVGENPEALRLPLPMSRLARHHLDRERLSGDSTERRAAVREQLRDLHAHWLAAWQLRGPLSLFRGLDARLGRSWAARAARAQDPLAALQHARQRQTGFSTLWKAWSAGRAARMHAREHIVDERKRPAD